MSYPKFHKINRLYNEAFSITEKIDGTNGLIYIEEASESWRYDDADALDIVDGYRLFAGSRSRWIYPDNDNHGFSAWALKNPDSLVVLGKGHHFGEWAGPGINGNPHNLNEKTFFLFNWRKWKYNDNTFLLPFELPHNVTIVPVLEEAIRYNELEWAVAYWIDELEVESQANPGGRAEGIVVESNLNGQMWKYFCGGAEKNATRKGS